MILKSKIDINWLPTARTSNTERKTSHMSKELIGRERKRKEGWEEGRERESGGREERKGRKKEKGRRNERGKKGGKEEGRKKGKRKGKKVGREGVIIQCNKYYYKGWQKMA